MGRTHHVPMFQGTEAAKAPKTKPTVAAFGTCGSVDGLRGDGIYTHIYIHIHIMIGFIMIHMDLQ